MKLGIATISRNAGPYLEMAVKSVLRDPDMQLKYVVQDCLSSDGSLDFLDSFSDPRLTVVRENDQGPADGLNRAFTHLSDCEVIGWINSDDFYLDGSLSFVSRFFQLHPNVKILQGAGEILYTTENQRKTYVPRAYTTWLARRHLTSIFQPSLFFRHEILPSPPFNADNKTCWDAELLFHVVSTGHKVHRVYVPLGVFRLHEKSISGTGLNLREYKQDEKRFLGSPSPHRMSLKRLQRLPFVMEAQFRFRLNHLRKALFGSELIS